MTTHALHAAVAAITLAAHACPASALVITPTSDAGALSGALFLNSDLLIQNTSFSGSFGQAGTYTNASGVYGLPNVGIALSTGNVANYGDGPSKASGSTTIFNSMATKAQNDLLFPITGQARHFDVSQLDIDFIPTTAASSVTFFATFGSEEFEGFVDSTFVDGFGLFVNGRNVAGVLQTGGAPGGPLKAVNINHPDMAFAAGTELNSVLAPNGNPVLRFDVPINPAAANTFTIIVADASDAALDTTIYLSSLFAPGGESRPGTTEFNPLLPSNPPDPVTGAFVIQVPDGKPAGATIWVDPPVSVGFEYEVLGGAELQTVTAPSLATVADLDGYLVTVGGVSAALAAGETLDFLDIFGLTPTMFTLTGIDAALALDPLGTDVFPAGLSLTTASNQTSVVITPIVENTSTVPLPAAAVLYLGGLAALGFVGRRRRGADARG